MGLVYLPIYIYYKNKPNVGKYTSPMDAMGNSISGGFEDSLLQCLATMGDISSSLPRPGGTKKQLADGQRSSLAT